MTKKKEAGATPRQCVSRSGYYVWSQAPISARRQREQQLRTKIALVHQQSRETYGSPRLTIELQSQGEQVGRHRVTRLMQEAGLRGRQKRRYRVRTTDSAHSHPIAPNRLATLSTTNPPSTNHRHHALRVNHIPLPAGFSVSFTGMKVLKHDGSPHHGVGIRPTIPASPTRAGIAAGRDELLEVAIAAAKGGPTR
jgi:hypothetical protein